MKKIKRTFGFILNHPLGKKHPLNALIRFTIWQLQSLLSPSKFIVKNYIGDVKFYARKGLTGITGNIYTGLHEFEEMAFLLHFLEQEDAFFDVGANVGSYTLLASGACGSKTIAIEPAQNTFNILNKNVVLNNLDDKVTLVNAIAGEEESSLVFSKNQDTTNHVISSAESEMAAESLPVIKIDSLLATAIPSLIKIDVEGYETMVLKGMENTLAQPVLKAIIIELNNSGGRYGFDEKNIHQLLESFDFRPFKYNAFSRELHPLETFGSYNTIYCRDTDFINNRLKNAAKVQIMGVVF